MLARNFKSADDLGLTEQIYEALIIVLGMMERGEMVHFQEELLSPTEKGIHLFNMGYWMEPISCGTVHCIGGSVDVICGLSRAESHSPRSWKNQKLYDLYFPYCLGDVDWGDITLEHGAQALRNYLTLGEARWLEVMTTK